MTSFPTELAERQHGLLTSEQLRGAGLSSDQIHWLIKRDRLSRISPRVQRVPGAPDTRAQRLLAAVLDSGPGSALSHSTALAWWGLPGFLYDEIHVTHTRDGVHRPARRADHVHDVVLLPERHIRVLEGVPVVSPARALFDIAGQNGIHPKRVERAVDNAWSDRLVSGRCLEMMLDDLAQRGRPGIRVMREIVEARGSDYIPPASGLEARVEEILRDDGQAPLCRQVNSGDDETWIGRVDFRDQLEPFILEVQSERFHASLLDQQADRDRLSQLEAAGFVVVTVSDTDVWHRKRKVADAVRHGRYTARRLRVARQIQDA